MKAAGLAGFASANARGNAAARPPNVILIYADDLGYGDLSCYGSPIATPNLDRMAEEGVRFTQFCSTSAVCSPSRAALLTGRYPVRYGIPRVLVPSDRDGLPESETTIAQMLKDAGYATMCIGKWHLGSRPEFSPTRRGFDHYYGLLYSNDMWPRSLYEDADVVEQTARLSFLTRQYTEQAVKFINRNREKPFFLYLPHTAPHIPLEASPDFAGRSGQGVYGDVVQELDWSVGRILQTLKDAGLDENTLVMFSSDNGPWYQGSPGRLRGRKGSTYEGGMRVPFLARMPGRIPAGRVVDTFASTMDVLPTVGGLSGAARPGLPLDGVDIWPLLAGQGTPPAREIFLYFNDEFLQCARAGDWKLHVARYDVPMFVPEPGRGRKNLPLARQELYNVLGDREEAYDRAERNQGMVAGIRAGIDRVMATMPPGVQQTYRDTLSFQVEDTSVGSLPVEKVPQP
ncbi:MAG: sulfatase [Bryobacteraceae bacterium]